MDIENLIIGFIFLLTGVAVFVYKFRHHKVNDDEIYAKVNGKIFIGTLALILFAIHLIWKEIETLI